MLHVAGNITHVCICIHYIVSQVNPIGTTFEETKANLSINYPQRRSLLTNLPKRYWKGWLFIVISLTWMLLKWIQRQSIDQCFQLPVH